MSKVLSEPSRRHFAVQNTACRPKITVSADGSGIMSHAGAVLLTRAWRVTGLDPGLAVALGWWKVPRAVHDPGKIIADLAVALALCGDCLADIVALRAEPALFGPVASDSLCPGRWPRTRCVPAGQLAGGGCASALGAIRATRAAARERAWTLAADAAPGCDGGLVAVDIDATIVTFRSTDVAGELILHLGKASVDNLYHPLDLSFRDY